MKRTLGILYSIASLAMIVSTAACSMNATDERTAATDQGTGTTDSDLGFIGNSDAAADAPTKIHLVSASPTAEGLQKNSGPEAMAANPIGDISANSEETDAVHETAELTAVVLPADQYKKMVLKFTGYLHTAALKEGIKIVWRYKGYGAPEAVEFYIDCTPSPEPGFTNQCTVIPHYYYSFSDGTYIGWFHTNNLYQVEIDPALAKIKDTDNLKFEFTVPKA